MPTACGYWVAIAEDWVKTRRAGSDQWFGSCRPPESGIGLAGEDRQEDFEGCGSPRQRHSHVAVVGQQPVVVTVESEDRSHLDRLVAGGSDNEGNPALAIEGKHSIVDAAGREHQAIHVEHGLVGQTQTDRDAAPASSTPSGGSFHRVVPNKKAPVSGTRCQGGCWLLGDRRPRRHAPR